VRSGIANALTEAGAVDDRGDRARSALIDAGTHDVDLAAREALDDR
jgi:hypothetical protein